MRLHLERHHGGASGTENLSARPKTLFSQDLSGKSGRSGLKTSMDHKHRERGAPLAVLPSLRLGPSARRSCRSPSLRVPRP